MSVGTFADIIDILDPQVHAAELLEEEFAGPRRALVARVCVDNAAAVVEDVYNQVLTTHGHDSAGLEVHGIKAALDSYRGNDLRQLDAMTPFIPRDDATQRSDYFEAIHEQGQRPGEIALVREDRMLNAIVLRDQTEFQGGGSNINSKCLFSHSSLSITISRRMSISSIEK
jgi:hypothetical protein